MTFVAYQVDARGHREVISTGTADECLIAIGKHSVQHSTHFKPPLLRWEIVKVTADPPLGGQEPLFSE